MTALEVVCQFAVAPVEVGHEAELLEVEFVADEALKGGPVVDGAKVKLQLDRRPEDDVAPPATGVQLPFGVGPVLAVVRRRALGQLPHRLLLDACCGRSCQSCRHRSCCRAQNAVLASADGRDERGVTGRDSGGIHK